MKIHHKKINHCDLIRFEAIARSQESVIHQWKLAMNNTYCELIDFTEDPLKDNSHPDVNWYPEKAEPVFLPMEISRHAKSRKKESKYVKVKLDPVCENCRLRDDRWFTEKHDCRGSRK